MTMREVFVFAVLLLQIVVSTEGANETSDALFTHGVFYQLESGACGSELIGYLGPVFSAATRLNCALA